MDNMNARLISIALVLILMAAPLSQLAIVLANTPSKNTTKMHTLQNQTIIQKIRKIKKASTTSNVGGINNIYTNIPFIWYRNKEVSTTIYWNDGRVSTLKWFIVATLNVAYQDYNEHHVAEWYIPLIEVRKDYNLENGDWFSGYHIDDTYLLGIIEWHAAPSYDELAFDGASYHYIPRAGVYTESEQSSWSISISIPLRFFTMSITWTPKSTGKEKVSVITDSNSFYGEYADMHPAPNVHAAYPSNEKYADWAVALLSRIDKLEQGTITFHRVLIEVKYHKWDWGGAESHYEYRYINIPINSDNINYNYNNYNDGENAFLGIVNGGTWG